MFKFILVNKVNSNSYIYLEPLLRNDRMGKNSVPLVDPFGLEKFLKSLKYMFNNDI